MSVIFPEINDWVHDKITGIIIDGKEYKGRPDYRSEDLKMIVEFDGLPHYTNPDIILKDTYKDELYKEYGYKVVRIPYFIQLSNEVVYNLFGVKVQEKLFDEKIPSLSIKSRNTPAFLCPMGIRRMAIDFINISLEQCKINVEALAKQIQNEEDELLAGLNLLKEEMDWVEYNDIMR